MVIRTLSFILLAAASLAAVTLAAPAPAHSREIASLEGIQRLKIDNDFEKPEDVVQYYCARDASGFVWSGFMDLERVAFTTWQTMPQFETFYIARDYRLIKPDQPGPDPRFAEIDVVYDIVAIGDGHGTRMPAPNPQHRVTYNLKLVGGRWKIVSPSANSLSPVVVESKFFFAPR